MDHVKRRLLTFFELIGQVPVLAPFIGVETGAALRTSEWHTPDSNASP